MEWKTFGHRIPKNDCFYDSVSKFVTANGYLPIECRKCYKALIFWPYSEDNLKNFKLMLKSLPISIQGKYNESVVVFYTNNKENLNLLIETLADKMQEFNVTGRIQWRVSGKYWQDLYPQFFKSAKELNSVEVSNEITMKQWMENYG